MSLTPEEKRTERAWERRHRFGLVLYDKRLCWGGRSKVNWIPNCIQHWVIKVWNPTVCFIFGHRWLCRQRPGELPICADCNWKIKRFNEADVMNEW